MPDVETVRINPNWDEKTRLLNRIIAALMVHSEVLFSYGDPLRIGVLKPYSLMSAPDGIDELEEYIEQLHNHTGAGNGVAVTEEELDALRSKLASIETLEADAISSPYILRLVAMDLALARLNLIIGESELNPVELRDALCMAISNSLVEMLSKFSDQPQAFQTYNYYKYTNVATDYKNYKDTTIVVDSPPTAVVKSSTSDEKEVKITDGS